MRQSTHHKASTFGFIFLLIFFINSKAYAKNSELEISPSQKFVFHPDKWEFGEGALAPGLAKQIVYSHKSAKGHNVFFEDLFLPKASLKERLPKECLVLIDNKEPNTDYCVSNSLSKNDGIAVISLFKNKSKNVVKVRTTFVSGTKTETAGFLKMLTSNRTPASTQKWQSRKNR